MKLHDRMIERLPDNLLPKSKIKSPRNQICKINKNGSIVYLLYVKFTNHVALSEQENKVGRGITKNDYAGVFESRQDANYIAECLNKIFKWYHVYDNQYKLESPYWVKKMGNFYVVDGHYRMIGNIGRKKFMTELLVSIVSDKRELQHAKEQCFNHVKNNLDLYLRKIFPNDINKIHMEPTIHVARYKLNDVMPTMNLDDYSIEKHKKHVQLITNELLKYPHNKAMKNLIGELEYLPPTKNLKSGGIQYQKQVNEPEFKKRWNI